MDLGLAPQNERFRPYKTGSLQAHVAALVFSGLSGKTVAVDLQKLFTANNHNSAAPAVTRNPDIWLPTVDLTPISVTSELYPCILINSRHIYMAAHTQNAGPHTFKRSDGGYETRTVTSWFTLTTINTDTSIDITIGRLSAPITNITPAVIPPTNFENWWPAKLQSDATGSLPMTYMPALVRSGKNSQDPTAEIARLLPITIQRIDGLSTANPKVKTEYPISTRDYWWAWGESELQIVGNSGSPVFLPVNGRMMLLSTFRSAADGTYPATASVRTTLENGMAAMAVASEVNPDYTFITADLSTFATY